MKKLLIAIILIISLSSCHYRIDQVDFKTCSGNYQITQISEETMSDNEPHVEIYAGKYSLIVGKNIIETSDSIITITKVNTMKLVRDRSIKDLGKIPNIYNRVVVTSKKKK